VSACVLGLAGCGGGGGGDPPTPTPLTFTDANATQAAGFVIKGLDQVAASEDVTYAAAYFLSQGIRNLACRAPTPVPVALSLQDNDMNGALSAGDVITFKHDRCNGSTRDLTITLTKVENQAQQLEGRVDFKIDFWALHAEGTMTLSMSIAADELRWVATGAVVRLTSGGATQVLEIPSAERLLTPPASLIASLPRGPGTLFVAQEMPTVRMLAAAPSSPTESLVASSGASPADAEPTNVAPDAEPAAAAPNYFVELDGTVASPPGSLGGSYAFATDPAFRGSFGNFPTSGALVLTGGSSKVRIRPATDPSGEQAEYQIDATGTGAFSDPKPIRWDALGEGNAFGYEPNSAPKIADVRISPENPTKNSDLSVTYQVFDADGDPVNTSIEWRRNGGVIAGQTSSSLFAGNFARFDTVTVTVRASDGRASSVATASVTIGSATPVIRSLTIGPEPAYTNTDLKADATASDPDDDPVQLSFAWRRNGLPIPGQTSRVLPASAQEVGDMITVVVSATDGWVTATQESRAITIVDSPPQFRSNAPAVASPGSLVTFKVDAFDPDDPAATPSGTFVLTHGPAGMTIDSATGTVTWVPQTPLFDRTLDVSWGVTFADGAVVRMSNTIRIEDPGHNYALMRGSLEAPVWPAGLRIGDFDGDGDNEMLIVGRHTVYELSFDGAGGYRQSWMYPFALAHFDAYTWAQNTASALATGDTDGDGKQELFLGAGNRIVKLDGVERRVVASAEFPDDTFCADLELGDLDNDGAKELVCLVQVRSPPSPTGRIRVYSAGDLSLRVELPAAAYGNSLAVGDVDDDGFPEIVTSGGYVVDGRKIFTDPSHADEWVYGAEFGADIDIGNIDGIGTAEIVASTAEGVRGYDAVLQTQLFDFQTRAAQTVAVRDIDSDPSTQEIVVVSDDGTLTAYRYDPAHPNSPSVVFQLPGQYVGPTPLGIGNVDADAVPEFVYATGTNSTGADQIVIAGVSGSTAAVEWTNDDPSELDGPFVGGELAGALAIPKALVFGTPRTDSGYAGARLIRMSPSDGGLTISAEIDTDWSDHIALTPADYDLDGTDEIFLSTAALFNGYFGAYDVFANQSEWVGPKLGDNYAGVSIVAADVTGDGHDDLVGLTSAGVVQVYDVFNRTAAWQGSGGPGVQVFVADVDGDGTLEIVVLARTSVYLYRRADGPGLYVQSAVFTRPNSYPYLEFCGAAIGDLDGDGHADIAALLSLSYGGTEQSELYVLDRNLQPTVDLKLPYATSGVAIENSAFPRKNLLLNLVPILNYNGAAPSYVAAVDPRTGEEVWRSPPLIGPISPASVHYVEPDGDGNLRLSVGTGAGMYVTR
jgi:hypothetical protein